MALDHDSLDALKIDPAARAQAQGGAWRWLLLGVLTIAVAAAVFWWQRPQVLEVAVVQAGYPAQRSAQGSTVLNATGYVVARRLATVSSKVTGKVVEVLIEEGQVVAEGEVLARLDRQSEQVLFALAESQLDAARNGLAETQVRLDEAERNLARTQRLKGQNLISQAALDAAEAEAQALRARLQSARSSVDVSRRGLDVRRQALEDLIIRAPFAGVVISKDAQPGEMISPISAGGGFTRTGICTIVDMDSREIEVDVNEAYINRVTAGQRADARLDAYPDWEISAQVINIVPTADRQKATVKVRIGFDVLDPRILPDMGVKVRFLEDRPAELVDRPQRRPVATLPEAALSRDGEISYAWLVVDNRLERRALSLGGDNGDRFDVLGGLRPGDVVVVDSDGPLSDGAAVRIK